MASERRKKIRSWTMLGILGLALIAIVITGFGTDGVGGLQGGGANAATLVKVDGEELTDAEFNRRFNDAYQQLLQQNPTLTRAQFVQQYFDVLLDSSSETLSLVAFSRDQGFTVPRIMVDRAIVNRPEFQNAAGQYEDSRFRAYLAQAGLDERQFRREREQELLMRMAALPVAGGFRLPESLVTEYANLVLERRIGSAGAVPTEALARGIQPSDQEIAQYYQRNQRSFALPERRVLRYALLGREQLGDSVRATDAEVAAYFQQNQARYGAGETRNLFIFTAQDEASARNFAQQIQRGTSFLDAARAAGFSAEDVSFQNLTREQVTQRSDANFTNAVFGAQIGGLVGPQQTQTGFQVARVEAVNRTPGRSLETVRAEIVTAVEQAKLAEQLNALMERVEERLGNGESLQEIATAERLSIQTSPPVDANGAGSNFQFPAELAPLLRTGFEFAPDTDPQLEVIQPDKLGAIVTVAQVVPSAAPPLDQIKDQVRQRLVRETALARARTIAEGIVNRINGGMAPAQAYAQAGIPLQPVQPLNFRRTDLQAAGRQVPAPLRILFSIPQGRARMVPAPSGAGWIIVHHQQRVAGNARNDPNGPRALEAGRGIGREGQGELLEQFVKAVRGTLGPTRNEDAVNAMRERLRAAG